MTRTGRAKSCINGLLLRTAHLCININLICGLKHDLFRGDWGRLFYTACLIHIILISKPFSYVTIVFIKLTNTREYTSISVLNHLPIKSSIHGKGKAELGLWQRWQGTVSTRCSLSPLKTVHFCITTSWSPAPVTSIEGPACRWFEGKWKLVTLLNGFSLLGDVAFLKSYRSFWIKGWGFLSVSGVFSHLQ